MAIINRLPKGFLSFLDQQTQGRNPQEPQPGLFLTSNLDAFYRSQQVVGNEAIANVTTTNANTIVATSIASIAVPEGFVWEILAIEARLQPNNDLGATAIATETIQLRVPFNVGGVGLDQVVRSERLTMSAVPGNTTFSATTFLPPQRLILSPGVVIRAQISETLGLFALVGVQNILRVARYQWQI